MLEIPQYGLAIHTTSPELGLALSNFADDSRAQTWDYRRSLATNLHQQLAEFIAPQIWQDLAFIAVAKGPGGFTGTRIGMVTARTLAQQLNIPLFTISSLAAVAWSSQVRGTVAVQMSAQREQLFTAIYQIHSNGLGINPLQLDTVMSPENWQQTLANWSTSYQLIVAENGLGATVSSLLEIAHLDWQQGTRPHWSEALPFYGQHPVAEC